MAKTQFLLAFLVACSTPIFAEQPPQQQQLPNVLIQSIDRLLPCSNFDRMSSGDLLVLDLDNTVFREAQLIGTDDWYSYAEHALRERGFSHDEAEATLHPLNLRIKSVTRMRLMEEGMEKCIESLQERGVEVIGLTARHPDFADITISQLSGLGIGFQPTVFTNENMKGLDVSNHHPPLFKGGIAFVRGGKKGHVLRAMLERTGYRPANVVAIDDRIGHTNSFVEALTEMQIPGRVIHYVKALEEPPFDPNVADMQTRYFEATGHLMSDERAKRECELLLSEEEAKILRNPDYIP